MVADVGDDLSLAVAPDVHVIEATSRVGPGPLGSVFGGVVYHNYYGTRYRPERPVIDGITHEVSAAAWRDAVAKYVDRT